MGIFNVFVKAFEADGVKANYPIKEDYEDSRYLPSYFFEGEVELVEDCQADENTIKNLEIEFSILYTKAELKFRMRGVNGDEMIVVYNYGSGSAWYKWVNEVGAVSFGRKKVDF